MCVCEREKVSEGVCVRERQRESNAIAHHGVATVSRIDKIWVSFAKEPYKRDYILYKRPIILSILLAVATLHVVNDSCSAFQRTVVGCGLFCKRAL